MPLSERLYGFNLTNLCFQPGDWRFHDMVVGTPGKYSEDDFRWIAEWGFNHVRLAVAADWLVRADEPLKIDEDRLDVLDQALIWGRSYGLQVTIGLIQGLGYTSLGENRLGGERGNLWTDTPLQQAFVEFWTTLAARWRSVPAHRLAFNLLNEPSNCTADQHERIMRMAVHAIRAVDAQRPIMLDGMSWGHELPPQLDDLAVDWACRGYSPFALSHYQAWWCRAVNEPVPTWPLGHADGNWRRKHGTPAGLREYYHAWQGCSARGARVHVGEFGAWNRTPHATVLAWMEELLVFYAEQGWGWALWNFRGSFGILDSARGDVSYETWHGHHLDRQMLELLQRKRCGRQRV